MHVVYTPRYTADIGTHVFPTEKYNLIYQMLAGEKIIQKNDTIAPVRPSDDDLRAIVTEEYLDDLLHARLTARTYPSEMPVKQNIIDAQILCCGGSFQTAQHAMVSGGCYHIGGGFHHAFPEHAEGFCYLNDVVFAAAKMLKQGVDCIAVIDLDLHQGNGTAKFFENETRVFTFSMHQERLYPKKERSSLDIGLEIGIKDEEYLEKLERALDRIFNDVKPSLIIYLAGADPYIFDQLGNLCLTLEGLQKRDEAVIHRAFANRIPVAIVLGGGYAEDVHDTVEIHCNTARILHKTLISKIK
ncbi:histone deacetylase [candidate division WOR-3 bacterium]|nr:histone deacetylase [candidate division WOR-3 bacterium]